MMMGLNKVQLDHQKSVVVDSKLVEMVVFLLVGIYWVVGI